MKNVLITTEWKGVFLAQCEDDADLSLQKSRTLNGLSNIIMVINWRNALGVTGICTAGPDNCKLSPATPECPALPGVTGVFGITDAAAKKIWRDEK
ncbi:MAG: hypothetical protein KDD10_30760 [Phaeodactylibacter sp.]|nr:hypothetical protein [Phaeodactylibacter sp.]